MPTDTPAVAATSPTTGDDAVVEVPLVHARWRNFTWAAFLGGIGLAVLIFSGAVGKLIGGLLLVAAAPSAVAFVRTLAHDAGRINVDGEGAWLPPALCSGERTQIAHRDLRHAYLLRRALPPMTQGPLLVVETTRGTYTYPRDWFVSEADQRRIAASINRRALRA